MPTALGGKGGGVTTDEEHILWVKNRLENFPTLPDLSLPVSTSSGEQNEMKKENFGTVSDSRTAEGHRFEKTEMFYIIFFMLYTGNIIEMNVMIGK